MRKAIQITIPEPCHEDWNTMTLELKGRHCSVCEKTVFDFTTKTDEYIVKTFEQDSKLCGRFKNSQLNRELAYSRKGNNNYLTYLASTLFAFIAFGTNNTYAQGGPIKTTQSYNKPIQVKGKVAHSILKERLISGTVLDENGLPMPGVSILIKGTKIGTHTDFDGNYKLKVKKGNTLTLYSIGYKTLDIKIIDDSLYNNALEVDINYIDEVIFTGGISVDSNYVHKKSPEEIVEEQKRETIRKQNHKAHNKRLFTERINEQYIRRQHIRNGELERTKVGQFLYTITNIFRKRK